MCVCVCLCVNTNPKPFCKKYDKMDYFTCNNKKKRKREKILI